jgi:8-oxo-dGTP pyrophosphatase MutT (NUDIX family)
VTDSVDWTAVPIFGVPQNRVPSTIRPSAYGLVVDERGLVAVVRTPTGIHLPGGGSDAGETAPDTVVREAREETGLVVQIGAWRRWAIEHVWSVAEQAQFEKWNTFCDARVTKVGGDAIELDHEMFWLPPAEAAEQLSPLSHQWAVREWNVRQSGTKSGPTTHG